MAVCPVVTGTCSSSGSKKILIGVLWTTLQSSSVEPPSLRIKIPILHYLASLCPATTCGVVVVKALKDDSVIREAKNLGIA